MCLFWPCDRLGFWIEKFLSLSFGMHFCTFRIGCFCYCALLLDYYGFVWQVDGKTRVYVFCETDFSQCPSEMEDCFSAVAFDVLENAANVCDFTISVTVYIYCNVYFLGKLKVSSPCTHFLTDVSCGSVFCASFLPSLSYRSYKCGYWCQWKSGGSG